MDIPAGMLIRPHNLPGLGQLPHPRPREPPLRVAGHLRQRRQRGRLRRVLGRPRPRLPQHGAAHAGHRHRRRHHHRRPAGRRRAQPRRRVRPHHHRLHPVGPRLRLRPARPPGSLRLGHRGDRPREGGARHRRLAWASLSETRTRVSERRGHVTRPLAAGRPASDLDRRPRSGRGSTRARN